MKVLAVFLLIAIAAVSAARVRQHTGGAVNNLPGLTYTEADMYAGYITVDPDHDGNLFYWMMESRNDPSTDPLALWMTGGPGCSSELAVMFENGPFHVHDNLTLTKNPYSWNNVANIIYIDQPFGTGFSYAHGDHVRDETEMADYMYEFLQGFLQQYPQYQGRDFFVVGESYGGHYVPALTARIVAGNQNLQSGDLNIPLIAAGIGNGYVDPIVQDASYPIFAQKNNLITAAQAAKINASYANCLSAYNDDSSFYYVEVECGNIMQDVLNIAGNLNVYNIDLPCIGQLCYNFTTQTNYMNQDSVQDALHAKKMQWATCDPSDIDARDEMGSFRQDVQTVVESGVRVLVYSGKLDLICNYVGGGMWVEGMPWTYQKQFNSQPLVSWSVDGAAAGQARNYGNLTTLWVDGAGHMVPHDQPQAALQLFTQLLQNTPFTF